jgi:tetratricopeptide (TPR) repeat protein
MGHQYGMSRAAVYNEAGEFEAALQAATEEVAREADNSEHWLDRATALAALERYDEAVADFERAQDVDAKTSVLDDDMLDDAYFSALLGAARATAGSDVAGGCAKLARYATRFPSGRHVSDAGDWQKRLRGELKSTFVKERLE